jgi:hypothetical protein
VATLPDNCPGNAVFSFFVTRIRGPWEGPSASGPGAVFAASCVALFWPMPREPPPSLSAFWSPAPGFRFRRWVLPSPLSGQMASSAALASARRGRARMAAFPSVRCRLNSASCGAFISTPAGRFRSGPAAMELIASGIGAPVSRQILPRFAPMIEDSY